jgi:hypothetical protein
VSSAPIPLATPPPPGLVLALHAFDAVRATLTIPAGVTRVWLRRKSPSGAEEFVRGVVDLTVTPSTVLEVYDYEAPIGVELEYHASSANAGGETSSTDTVATITVPAYDADDPWLVNVAQPTNTQQVAVASLAELAYDVLVGVHHVMGRRAPIVTSDVAPTPAFELVFSTETETARDRARATLGDGIPVLLRTPPSQGVGTLYFAVLSWAEQRPSRLALHADRLFRVRAQEVDRPDPKLFVPTTLIESYSGVLAEYDDYGDVAARAETYSALLFQYGGPGTVEPWPPEDA